MRTKEKHWVDMLKGVALVEYGAKVQRNLLISPKPCAFIGCVLDVPWASRIPSTVWGLMTLDFIPS